MAVNYTGAAPQTIAYDLDIMTTRPAPSWSGSTSLYVSCPSHNLSNSFVGPKSFDGLPAVEFRTVLFTLPAAVTTALASGCQDLSFRLAINIPSGTTGSYILDNLRFNPPLPILSPGPTSVLGFENSNEWSISNQPTQPVVPSTLHTQGNSAIQFTANGYTVVRGADLATIGPIGNAISYDIWIPGVPAGAWPGQTALIINSPSLGISNQTIATKDLSGLPAGQFSTVTFTIPNTTQGIVSSGHYDDLSFSIVVNVNTSGTYRLDNLSIGTVQPTLSCIDLLDSTHAVAHFGYSSGLTTAVSIPLGPSNFLQPAAAPSPPTSFSPGSQPDILDVPFGPPQISWVLGSSSVTATMTSKTCFPPTTVLKCTPGSVVADCMSQVVTQVSASNITQRANVISDLGKLAGMPGFSAALANDVTATFNPLGHIERILVEVAMLGVMKTPEGTQALKQIVHTSLPTSGTCHSIDGRPCDDFVERGYVSMVQTKAIDGLGFMRNTDGDGELLAAVSSSANPGLQVRAVSAYLWNHGATASNRALLSSILPSGRRFLADVVVKDSNMTLPVLGQAMIDFYNKHPEMQPPFPQ